MSSETALGSFMADITNGVAGCRCSLLALFTAGGSMILDRRLGTRQVMEGGVWVGL